MRQVWPYIAIALVLAVAYAIARKMKKLAWPVEGRISSYFGERIHPITGFKQGHNGIDIAVPEGTPVLAPADGEVTYIGNHSTGGKQMAVTHANGLRTGYAHLSDRVATVGQKVKKGEVIAYSGNTGASSGPHLHFTVTNSAGIKVDPVLHLA